MVGKLTEMKKCKSFEKSKNLNVKMYKCKNGDVGLGSGRVQAEKIREEFIGSKGPNLLRSKAANVLSDKKAITEYVKKTKNRDQ